MNIAIFDISATKREVIKSSLSSHKRISNLYLFGSIESLAKLPFFSNVDIIIITAESVKSNIAFFTKFTTDRNHLANIIFLYNHENQSTLDFLKSVKNLTACYVPSLNKNGEILLRELKLKLFPVIDKIISSHKTELEKNKIQNTKTVKKVDNYCAVFIGVSMGGPKALRTLLPELLENIELPIIIVQHIMQKFSNIFVDTLSSLTNKKILLAQNNMIIENNTVYIAPGGIHIEVGLNKNNELIILYNDSPPEQSCKPSINYLFRSAAEVCKEKSIAVILTGMGKDGTDGIMKLTQNNAYTIAQDEKSCEVWGMPQSAIQTGCITQVLPLDKIANHISELLS
ncbi:MAG: chemotaxis protein CheB [Ignavibacteriae bacterium]|nr:chemotaxis protein CheB [Ignavibacteriota bacterium]